MRNSQWNFSQACNIDSEIYTNNSLLTPQQQQLVQHLEQKKHAVDEIARTENELHAFNLYLKNDSDKVIRSINALKDKTDRLNKGKVALFMLYHLKLELLCTCLKSSLGCLGEDVQLIPDLVLQHLHFCNVLEFIDNVVSDDEDDASEDEDDSDEDAVEDIDEEAVEDSFCNL